MTKQIFHFMVQFGELWWAFTSVAIIAVFLKFGGYQHKAVYIEQLWFPAIAVALFAIALRLISYYYKPY